VKSFIYDSVEKQDMYPHAHFMAGILCGVIGYKIGFLEFFDMFIIGAIAVLIDIDHYIYHIVHAKSYHPIKFWNTVSLAAVHQIKSPSYRTFIHHRKGIYIISVILAIVMLIDFRIGFIKASAYYTHMVLDHLKYFHIRITDYKLLDFHGVKFVWNYPEEVVFAAMILISVAILTF